MKTAIIIPARYASTRFPGKPLKDETGKPLIQHVYEAAKLSRLADGVFIATDDKRIQDIASSFGADAILTATTHESGTDRLAEAAKKIGKYDIVVNVQGDEPEIEASAIDKAILIQKQYNPFMTTLACKFPGNSRAGTGSPLDPACVKVVLQENTWGAADDVKTAAYFSRSLIPFPRSSSGNITDPSLYYMHVGLYAYSLESLLLFSSWPRGTLESIEQLEQLRAIEKSKTIAVGIVDGATPGIDTPEDYGAFIQRWKNKK